MSVTDGEKAAPRQPLPGFTPRGGTPQWDASGFVKALGIPSLPGEEAIYDPESSTLIVKTSRENLEFLGSVLAEVSLEQPAWYLGAELSLYTYEPKPGRDLTVWPTPTEIFTSGPNAPRLIDSLSGAVKSGKKARFLRRSGTNGREAPPQEGDEELLGPNESGMAAEIESVVGPDETVIDTNLTFAWRGHLAQGLTADLRFHSTFTGLLNTPVVIQVSSLEKKPGTYLVVIANLRFETPVEWSLESVAEAAKKVRARRQPEAPSP